MTLKFDGWPWKTIRHLFYATSSFVHHFKAISESVSSNWGYSPVTLNLGQNLWFFVPCDLKIWWMTLNKANLRDLIAATGLVIILKLDSNRLIWVKSKDFFSHVTLQFDRWPWKTIGHLFHATWSFVHNLVAIGEFKLELQSRNAQFGSNLMILPLFSHVTLKFDGWPWKTIGHLS